MFKDETVFVVGAGASKEYGMPLGGELAEIICSNLRVENSVRARAFYQDRRADSLLREKFQDDRPMLESIWDAGRLIPRGLPHAVSIDSFIDMHSDKPGLAILGKLQIALEILRSERASSLFVDYNNTLNRLDFNSCEVTNGWLRPFTEILLEKVRANDLDSVGRGLTIICFNYDRLIEHYLLSVFEATLGIDYTAAHALVSQINIIHPYGSLGALPSRRGERDGLPFGADTESGIDIWKIVERLRTFTEEMEDAETLEQITLRVGKARNLVFLGFSFQAQNVELLKGAKVEDRVVRTLTTGIGIAEPAVDEVKTRMMKIAGPRAHRHSERVMIGVGCVELLRQNRLNLSQG